MLYQISPSVYSWPETHGAERGEPYPWNSYVIHLPDQNVLALIDPLAASDETLHAIETLGTPTHILLTCEFHLRESEVYQERWGCELHVNEVESDRYDVLIDGLFYHSEKLWDFIDPITITGVYYPETAFLISESGGILIVGDLLSGGRKDQNIPEGDLGIMGPEYIRDLNKARQSLTKLLGYEYTTMCFGHGVPLYQNARGILRDYIQNDAMWNYLAELKRTRPEPEIDY